MQSIRRGVELFLALSLDRQIALVMLLLMVIIAPPANAIWSRQIQPNASLLLRSIDLPLQNSIIVPSRLTAEAPSAQIPGLTAQGVFAYDLQSGQVVYAFQPDLQLPPASTTKIMTALVGLEAFDASPGSIASISFTLAPFVEGQRLRLDRPETFLFQDTMNLLLIMSANDAALSLALAHPQGYQGFVERMNKTAKQLGMRNTTFFNPSGMPQTGHLSTARDLGLLAREVLAKPQLREIVSSSSAEIRSVSGQSFTILSTNALLGQLSPEIRVTGLKTGYTDEAGECLVTIAEIEGHEVVVVMLGSSDRFGETEKVLRWISEQYDWKQILLD